MRCGFWEGLLVRREVEYVDGVCNYNNLMEQRYKLEI
jgi:hypothetical protein